MPSPIRVLFHCTSKRGLGHLTRGLNLAREMRLLAPALDMLFYTSGRSAAALCGRDFPHVVQTETPGAPCFPEVVGAFCPHVIIYDTLLPEDVSDAPWPTSTRQVYIMRRCREDKQREIFADPFMDHVDLILIPHLPPEFGYEIPPRLGARTCFAGPIVRTPAPEIQHRLRETYGIGEQHFVLTSTAGGGGFEAHAESFFATVFDVHRRLHPVMPHLLHLVVLGPNFGKSLTPLPGMRVVPFEPEMVNLLAISDLAIAEGGYNTVNEIRLAKTPAVFLPSSRSFDDQEERVRALEQRGLAFVLPQRGDGAARKIADLCASRFMLGELKRRYEADRMETGNRVAAERILELAGR